MDSMVDNTEQKAPRNVKFIKVIPSDLNDFEDSYVGASNTEQIEKVSDLYIKAAKQYLVEKEFLKSAVAFYQAGELLKYLDNNAFKSANAYISAANAYMRKDMTAAIKSFEKAIKILAYIKQYNVAGRHLEKISKIAEDQNRIDDAINGYALAAEYFDKAGNCPNLVTEYLLRVGYMAAKIKKFDIAIKNIEKAAYININKIPAFRVFQFYLEACLCHIAMGDYEYCKEVMAKYCENYKCFENSEEYKFIDSLIYCCINVNSEEFFLRAREWNITHRFQPWEVTIFSDVEEKLTIAEVAALTKAATLAEVTALAKAKVTALTKAKATASGNT
jgi:alpha-soluble NSF attachment protein